MNVSTQHRQHLLDARYELLRVIGTGGTGIVYDALDRTLENKRIAVKILYPHLLSDRESYLSFSREVLIARRLSHQNVVQTFGFATSSDSEVYITMELINGGNLKEFLLLRPELSWEQRVLFLYQAARGVAFAHQRGILHCDVKPHNMMVSETEEIKVADFGIAQVAWGSDKKCDRGIGICRGTPAYMSPEQFKGETLDERSDIYSWGISTYEAVYGRLPFEGTSFYEIAQAQLQEPFPPPHQEIAPAWLYELLALCCEKRKEARPANLEKVCEVIADHMSATTLGPTFLEVKQYSVLEPKIYQLGKADVSQESERFRRRVSKGICIFALIVCCIGFLWSGKPLWLFVAGSALAMALVETFESMSRNLIIGSIAVVGLIILVMFMPAGNYRAVALLLRLELATGLDLLPLKRLLGRPIRADKPEDWFNSMNDLGKNIRALLDSGAPFHFKKDGNTLLHLAVISRRAALVPLLLEGGLQLEERNGEGLTAAELAVANSRVEELESLLAAGAAICGTHGQEPLIVAAIKRRDPLLVQTLLNAGALQRQECIAEYERPGMHPLTVARETRDKAIVELIETYSAKT